MYIKTSILCLWRPEISLSGLSVPEKRNLWAKILTQRYNIRYFIALNSIMYERQAQIKQKQKKRKKKKLNTLNCLSARLTSGTELPDHKSWICWLEMSTRSICYGSKNTLINPAETKVCHFGHGGMMTQQTELRKQMNRKQMPMNKIALKGNLPEYLPIISQFY